MAEPTILKTLNGRPLTCIACEEFTLVDANGGGCDSCGYGSQPASVGCALNLWNIENGSGSVQEFGHEIWRAQTCPDFKPRMERTS